MPVLVPAEISFFDLLWCRLRLLNIINFLLLFLPLLRLILLLFLWLIRHATFALIRFWLFTSLQRLCLLRLVLRLCAVLLLATWDWPLQTLLVTLSSVAARLWEFRCRFIHRSCWRDKTCCVKIKCRLFRIFFLLFLFYHLLCRSHFHICRNDDARGNKVGSCDVEAWLWQQCLLLLFALLFLLLFWSLCFSWLCDWRIFWHWLHYFGTIPSLLNQLLSLSLHSQLSGWTHGCLHAIQGLYGYDFLFKLNLDIRVCNHFRQQACLLLGLWPIFDNQLTLSGQRVKNFLVFLGTLHWCLRANLNL